VNRILEQWDGLTLFFTAEVAADDLITTQNILDILKNQPVCKLYLQFVSFSLNLINNVQALL
jgi:hypothetical protein